MELIDGTFSFCPSTQYNHDQQNRSWRFGEVCIWISMSIASLQVYELQTINVGLASPQVA